MYVKKLMVKYRHIEVSTFAIGPSVNFFCLFVALVLGRSQTTNNYEPIYVEQYQNEKYQVSGLLKSGN